MTTRYLDFENSLKDIDKKINESQNEKEKEKLLIKKDEVCNKIYSNLNAWQKVQIARHPERPHTIHYIESLFSNFLLIAGDKKFADDQAIISGFAKFQNKSVLVLGTEKGNDVKTRIKHNFGMAKPEGYRKAERLYKLASRFNLPIICFIDTAGAYPGKEAEERGQAEAIASLISVSLRTNTPIISIIIGEGGSGGAIALATGDRILMLENSIYSVISPEGCASILWRDPDKVKIAAESLKLTAENCKKFKIIDDIIPELPGGAHRNFEKTIKTVGDYISNNLEELLIKDKNILLKERNEKFLNITSESN